MITVNQARNIAHDARAQLRSLEIQTAIKNVSDRIEESARLGCFSVDVAISISFREEVIDAIKAYGYVVGNASDYTNDPGDVNLVRIIWEPK